MPRRHRSDKQHQAALAHEPHRADPNYPREHAGSCDICLDLAVQLGLSEVAGVAERMQEKATTILSEQEAIDAGQLTQAQRTALLLYPGDSEADRAARAVIVAAPQDEPGAPRLGKITNAAARAYLEDAGLEWVLSPTEDRPVRMVGIPPLREYTELVTTHISRAVSAHYASEESRRSRQLTPHFYARRAIECLERALPPSVTAEAGSDEEAAPVVADDALRLIALTAEGSLVVPADPSTQGYRFWAGAVSDVQDHITEHGTEHLLMDARWQIPELGEGRLLDRCSSQQLAEMAAQTHVSEVDLNIDAEPVSSLEQALLITMTALYELVWETVAGLLGSGELRVQYRDQPGAAPAALLALAR